MTTSIDAHSRQYSHLNGTHFDLMERFAVAELCKGWPVYRDASEWSNYRDIFAQDAMVWTTWSKAQPIDNFISISKAGKDRGDFIMHRECGTLVEYSQEHSRAIGKMKGTITQRFQVQASNATFDCPEGTEYDVDCDCQFIFFCFKDPKSGGAWKAKYTKLFYLKDKVVSADGIHAPVFPKDVLDRYPEGYKYLGAAQSSLGYPVSVDLPTAKDHPSWFGMYEKMEQWLAGENVDLYCSDDVKPTTTASNGTDELKSTNGVSVDAVLVTGNDDEARHDVKEDLLHPVNGEGQQDEKAKPVRRSNGDAHLAEKETFAQHTNGNSAVQGLSLSNGNGIKQLNGHGNDHSDKNRKPSIQDAENGVDLEMQQIDGIPVEVNENCLKRKRPSDESNMFDMHDAIDCMDSHRRSGVDIWQGY